ncbi:MAG TPA: HIT family protein [Acidimicrobiia bacterium]|nr:HIT family protein [Acidimicrobiia bacterium]
MGCFVCDKHAQGSVVPGGIIYEDDLVYAGHILPPGLLDVYLGYVMIEPKRHVAGLGELTDGEAAALGVLVNNLGGALKDTEGAEHVYSFVLGDEVPHLHIHLVPRYSGAPREYWGVRASRWPDAPRGGIDEITAVCGRVRRALSLPQPRT